jgi:hypothetical protein
MTVLPKILGPYVPLGSEELAFVPVAGKNLPFTMQPQQQTNWCWAAVTFSVSHYYPFNGKQAAQMSQCQLATYFVNRPSCLNPMPPYGSDWPGNQMFTLQMPLGEAGHLAGTAGVLNFGQIAQQIDVQRPVCCHIQMGGVGHFLAITGYIANPEQDIFVQDPVPGPYSGFMPLAAFMKYRGGQWDESYATTP